MKSITIYSIDSIIKIIQVYLIKLFLTLSHRSINNKRPIKYKPNYMSSTLSETEVRVKTYMNFKQPK